MSSCIICGESVDGRVCELHEEDVVFEFRGTEPEQLTTERYYRGSVDGFADFGIFVDIGESVTGLLHRSELDSRLESIDLDPDETVFVKVKNVRDNGNIDLGWSIRQEQSRFRGTLVDDPDAGEVLPDDGAADGADVVRTQSGSVGADESDGGSSETEADTGGADESDNGSSGTEADTGGDDEPDETAESHDGEVATGGTVAAVDELADLTGERVRLEGELIDVRQTSGPTVFTLRDETGTVECAAFKKAGVRAYPEAEEGDVVRIGGDVERRRGELQIETEALAVLADEERDTVTERMEAAVADQARPDGAELLTDDPVVESVTEDIVDAASEIRRAVIEGRPVVVRHAGTVDGYVAGAALERATLPFVRDNHGEADAEYHQFERRPLEGSVYSMDDATRDVTAMLSAQDRHDEPTPLFVLVGVGSPESLDGFDLLDVYGASRVLVDGHPVDDAVAGAVDTSLSPETTTTTTTLAAGVATTIAPDVRADVRHLPAVSAWGGPDERYANLAGEAGYDDDGTRVLREALALMAYYQSYEDKRELVADLLFAEDADVGLAEHVSEQFRTRMDTAIETAEANLERHDIDGRSVLVLDTEAYTHQYEFPATTLLLDELHRRHDADALVGVDRDECHVRSDGDVDIEGLVAAVHDRAPEAALHARGARDGRIEFLAGEREVVREALVEALGTDVAPA